MGETQQQLEALTGQQIRAIVTRTAAANALGVRPKDSDDAIAFATRKLNMDAASVESLARRLRGLEGLVAKAAVREQKDLEVRAAEQRVDELNPLGVAMRALEKAKREAWIAKDAENELSDSLKEFARTDSLEMAELQSFVDDLKQQATPGGAGAPAR